MDEIEFFAPWRLVAAFADGSRLLFDGLTEEQAREAMEAAQEEHGYTGPLDENGLPVGLAEQIAQANTEEGRDPNEARIIIKRNAPPDDQPPHEK